MSQSVLVIAEIRAGKLRRVSLEAVHAANQSAGGAPVDAVIIGSGIIPAASELAAYVSGKVYAVDHPELASYNAPAYLAAVKGLLDELKPGRVFLGHTAEGKDLAPLVAAHLGAGQISDVIAVSDSAEGSLYTRPLYAGKAFEEKAFAGGAGVVTVRPNNLPPAELASAPAEVVDRDYAPASDLHSIVKDVVRKAGGKVDLSEAKIVISGGRGVKSSDGFKPLEELADVLGAAVGASRGACDAGYCDYALQIGQTGKVVTPEVYIACGISGAIQHLAGMSQSRVIIAINKDPEAPIFKVADYGIVGDLFEVVPLLTEEFRKVLA
ncbi:MULTISPECIES: electron transfer flavoprotein subunit alpha/FixB family protein [unclassified Paenibacillus]|uniref:electron transfer flavoprotein subunit alpha/FixB family protein n=1 Tax=unclassified Paenibacillus TaxID=185978 RepID=UPI0009562F5C|nr:MULTISPECIES: electron transfer flavoprotein subunit alpha/FixB family protein [unclassified Paenibacillus]ASS65538.1 electron transfer flavoprotein subunit alpha/FixB family protein [Paenibacillus sp. RUD330]SIQ32743.1 electron transfer flavoprotein alpha subunit [Paenibacillus sp. RU4X]SIQ54341.1 electron transfer flavoprotein alpha subunit [Paenibacillus sp. RU4T]